MAFTWKGRRTTRSLCSTRSPTCPRWKWRGPSKWTSPSWPWPTAKCACTKTSTSSPLSSKPTLLFSLKILIRLEQVTGMIYGVFGREEGCLILNYKSGGISAKILQRQANLTSSSSKPGAPPEQDIPLNIPKKTKLFVELSQREREQAPCKINRIAL